MRYKTDRVKAIKPAYAQKTGGCGDRYTIVVGGRETYLFFEHGEDVMVNVGRWFVEKRSA